MVRMRKLAVVVVGFVALAGAASACSDPGERVTAEPTSAAPTPSDAPADINQLVKAGDTFAVVNPLWWITPTLPPVLATTDREQWVALPDLPEPVAAVGLAAAGDRLIVTALACEAPNGGRDLCAQEPKAIEGASGTMLAWVVAPDLSSYEPIDLPDGLTRRECDILAFERQWWKYAGAKEEAIKELFSMSATRYYQVLNALVDRPEALAADPMLVKRLRRLRASRQKARAARRLGFELS